MLSGNYRMHGYDKIMLPVITGKHDFPAMHPENL